MIAIHHLRKRLGTAQTLDDVSAHVDPGETVAVVGQSGSGKTTLLRCLNALESFDSGGISIAGFSLGPHGGGLSPSDLARLRAAVGLVFQEHHLFAHLTVEENVALGPRVVRRVPRATATHRARELLSKVGLGDRGGAYPHELSGGQKQRVAIARALAQEPHVLLLDEPTSALDPETAKGVARTLADVTQGRVTVVLVTHQLELAESLATRILRLEGGRLTEVPHADR